MAYVLADRVRETSTTEGTGGYSLAGAVSGFRTFVSAIGAGNTTSYVATMGSQWEVGLGTVSSGPSTLSRTTIRASSNGGAAVNWTAGTKDLRCDADATFLTTLFSTLSGPTALSGTSFDFTTIQTGAVMVDIFIDGLSTNGTNEAFLKIGDSGGISTGSYSGNSILLHNGGGAVIDDFSHGNEVTIFFPMTAAEVVSGRIGLRRISSATHRWQIDGILMGTAVPSTVLINGRKTLSNELDRYQLGASGNTFDAGSVSTRIYRA